MHLSPLSALCLHLRPSRPCSLELFPSPAHLSHVPVEAHCSQRLGSPALPPRSGALGFCITSLGSQHSRMLDYMISEAGDTSEVHLCQQTGNDGDAARGRGCACGGWFFQGPVCPLQPDVSPPQTSPPHAHPPILALAVFCRLRPEKPASPPPAITLESSRSTRTCFRTVFAPLIATCGTPPPKPQSAAFCHVRVILAHDPLSWWERVSSQLDERVCGDRSSVCDFFLPVTF